jgi:hypothetical protein
MAEPCADCRHTPVTVTFTIEPGQVWVNNDDGREWEVVEVQGDIARLEGIVTEQRHVRDLVVKFTQNGRSA